jgi:hypothetical protein
MALFCQPGFSAAFGAADSFPFRFDGYFLKAPMLFAYKLVNRHSLLFSLAKTSYLKHTHHQYNRPNGGISLEVV